MVPVAAVVLCWHTSAWAGPMTGLEAGFSEVDIFDSVAIGPVAGAAAVADVQGRFDGRFTFGFGVTIFEKTRRVWRRPVWDFSLELGYQPRAAHFDTRAYVGRGIGPFTLGASVLLAAPLDRDAPRTAGLALGPELVLHLRTSPGSHSHVVQPFLRLDVFVINTAEFPTQGVGGLRFLF